MDSAIPEDGASSENHQPGYLGGHEDDQRARVEVQVEDSQYYETSTSHNVPTKTGDEDFVGETQLEDERPGTAGTDRSIPLDNDSVEMLERLTARPAVKETTPGTESHFMNKDGFLDRPPAEEIQRETSFSFAKVPRQQLDFTGTRKASSAIAQPENTETLNASRPPDNDVHAVELGRSEYQDQKQIHQSGHALDLIPQSKERLLQDSEDRDTHAPKKKRKKSGKRRSRTDNLDQTLHREDDAFDYTVSAVHNYGEVIEPPRPREDGLTLDNDSQRREQTPTNSVPQNGHFQEDSPHTQLHYDMQVATVDSDTRAEDPCPATQDATTTERETFHSSPAASMSGQLAMPQLSNPDAIASVDVMHRVSEGGGSVRVSKRRSKKSRTSAASAAQTARRAGETDSDINDYLQIVAYKIRQHEQSSAVKFEEDLGKLQVELQQLRNSKEVLQDELNQVLHERNSLASTADNQSIKVAKYESKIKKFKAFVDGLGNDINVLKREADSTRRKTEALIQEGKEHSRERDAIVEQLSSCNERSAQLTRETLNACQEAQSDLQAQCLRSEYLDQQLSEKVGLLSEERDRRSQLEKQVASVVSSDDKVLGAVQSVRDAVLENLSGIHASLHERHEDTRLPEALKETLAAVQALSTQATATEDHITLFKGLVEKINESLEARSKSDQNDSESASAIATSIKTRLDDTLERLEENYVHRETLALQNETIQTLQNKADSCNVRLEEANAQISKSRDDENKLKRENDVLKANISKIKSRSTIGDAQVETNDEIESLRSHLSSKAEESRALSTSNSNLREQLDALQSDFKEAQDTVIDLTRKHEDLQRQKQEAIAEMTQQMQQFERELTTEAKNELKKLKGERERLGKRLEPLQEELSTYKARLQELQQDESKSITSRRAEVERLSKLAQSNGQEIEALRTSLSESRSALESQTNAKEKWSNLSTQLNIEKGKLQETEEQKMALRKQVEDLQRATDDARLAEAQSISELANTRAENENVVQELQKELADAKQEAERAASGLQHFKESCKTAIDDAGDKSERRVKALQERLAEAQSELQKSKSEDDRFRAEVEKTWEQEQQKYDDQTSEIKRKMAEAESQRDEALGNNERLRKELQDAMNEQRDALTGQLDQFQQRAVNAEEKLKSQQRLGSSTSGKSSRIQVPSIREGITPIARLHTTAPIKPRKKVDRNDNITMEAGAIPVPVELRPDSRKTNSAGKSDIQRPPVVEDSQVVSDPFAMQSLQSSQAPSKPSLFPMSSDNDDMLSLIDGGGSKLLSEIRMETQEDSLPSFAAFNANLTTSHVPMSKPTSSVYLAPSRPVNEREKGRDPPEDFTIYEDSQNAEEHAMLGSLGARQELRDSLSWSQAEMDKYTYQITRPHPNSASKIVRHDGAHADSGRRRRSDTHHSTSSKDRAQTPKLRDEGRRPSRGMRPGFYREQLTNSSSPDFVPTRAESGRKLSTYNSGGGSGSKRRISRTHSTEVGDPRLVNRAPQKAAKRKADVEIVQGYEHERKKRRTAATNASSNDAMLSNVRSQSQSSSGGQQHLPTLSSGPTVSRYNDSTSTSQSRMRTLAGGNSRTTRGAKKASKNDEFNARFSKELDRR